jgi:pyridoxamine 5'-phosphate oxidase
MDPIATDLAQLRSDYGRHGLDLSDLHPHPLLQTARWLAAAVSRGVGEPNAATLSTVDSDGRPSGRIVLVKGCDEAGVTFFTNYESRKGRELLARPMGSLVLFWPEVAQQVRVGGAVERVAAAESDEYFATRPYGSQLGAWASAQSRVLASRADLEGAVEAARARFGDGPVPRPPHWGGYRLVPDEVEVWQGRESRLHDRFLYRREGDGWRIDRLWP